MIQNCMVLKIPIFTELKLKRKFLWEKLVRKSELKSYTSVGL